MSEPILIAVGVLLAAAAGASVFRIVRGPSILDRMIASDMEEAIDEAQGRTPGSEAR